MPHASIPEPAHIGHVDRLSKDSNTEMQIEPPPAAGYELVFQEKASGRRWERPESHRLPGQRLSAPCCASKRSKNWPQRRTAP